MAEGYLQTAGIDFTETFSHVIKPATIRIVITFAATRGCSIQQLDVNNAFLNGTLTEVVYIKQPPGFEVNTGSAPLVCKLNKAIHGLTEHLVLGFINFGMLFSPWVFVAFRADSSLFIHIQANSVIYVLVYVDILSSQEVTSLNFSSLSLGWTFLFL